MDPSKRFDVEEMLVEHSEKKKKGVYDFRNWEIK